MKTPAKKSILWAVCLCAAVCSASALTRYDSANAEIQSCAAQTEEQFVLRDYKGFVAVYDGKNAKNPASVTDIEVATLRALDRQMLKNGLVLDSREKLAMTLEDFES